MIHNDYVRSLKFNRTNNSIISASSDIKKPLVITDMKQINKEYNFNLEKVKLRFF